MSESPRRPGLEQEEDRINARGAVALAIVGIIAVAIAMWAGTRLTEKLTGRDVSASTAEQSTPRNREVREVRAIGSIDVTDILEDSTTRSITRMRRERLDAWGWADRDSGLVTIPIGVAMQLVAGSTRGARPEATAPAADSASDSDSDSAPDSAPDSAADSAARDSTGPAPLESPGGASPEDAP